MDNLKTIFLDISESIKDVRFTPSESDVPFPFSQNDVSLATKESGALLTLSENNVFIDTKENDVPFVRTTIQSLCCLTRCFNFLFKRLNFLFSFLITTTLQSFQTLYLIIAFCTSRTSIKTNLYTFVAM